MGHDLIECQSDAINPYLEFRILEFAVRLELARNRNWHRPSARIEVAEVEHDERSRIVDGAGRQLGDVRLASLDFSNANVSGRRTRPSSAFQWYAGSGLLVIWRGSRHARAITFGFP